MHGQQISKSIFDISVDPSDPHTHLARSTKSCNHSTSFLPTPTTSPFVRWPEPPLSEDWPWLLLASDEAAAVAVPVVVVVVGFVVVVVAVAVAVCSDNMLGLAPKYPLPPCSGCQGALSSATSASLSTSKSSYCVHADVTDAGIRTPPSEKSRTNGRTGE